MLDLHPIVEKNIRKFEGFSFFANNGKQSKQILKKDFKNENEYVRAVYDTALKYSLYKDREVFAILNTNYQIPLDICGQICGTK